MTADLSTLSTWQNAFGEARKTLNAFADDPKQMSKCAQFTDMILTTINNGGNLFICGNGGSHCDAMHFAEEFTGRYRKDRKPIGALALGNAPHVTCVANDYGFGQVFSRELGGLARAGDLLIGLSTSGNSANVINAIQLARELKIKTVALLGRDGGKLLNMSDLAIVIPAETSDRIQEMHIKILHTVIESVERKLFPENYK